jgi:predicted O-linked N-acetylglucosamine transferase (SPINDLY family)
MLSFSLVWFMTMDNAARAEAAFRQAHVLHQQGRLDEAGALYRQALQWEPRHFHALHLLGVIALQHNQAELALEWIGRALSIDPQSGVAHVNLGNAQHQLGRFEAAIASYDSAIALKPDLAEAFYNRGNVLRELGQHQAAVHSYDRAIAIKAGYVDAHLNRGLALSELQHYEAAIASYDAAIAINPAYAEAHYNRGNALRDQRQYEAAVASYDKAIALQPGYFDAHLNRGSALLESRRYIAAVAGYDRAIALRPDFANAYLNRGSALQHLQRYADALASYDKAIALTPNHAEAYRYRGNVLRELRDFEGAVASYDKAIALECGLNDLYANRRHFMMQICDWRDLDADLARLAAGIESGEVESNPFFVLGLSDSAPLQKKAAASWVRKHHPLDRSLPAIAKGAAHDKLRIGYFSGDFRNHPLSYLTAGLFETHDRSNFEVTAFSFGPETQDETRSRLKTAFDRFVDVRDSSDRDLTLLARKLGVDIAIDLGGFTRDARPDVFAMRAAPLQVSFLGYPGTMGAEYMDYLIADRTVVPEISQSDYSEKIIYLPDSYWPSSYRINEARRLRSDQVSTRDELRLPPVGFVFCCFNNNYKITPGTFDIWMRILRRVEGSVLWLFEDNPAAARNLRLEAARRDIRAERLIFAQRMPLPEHLARHRAADLFIDTLPCNAHTTASDALWAGLPVLTCPGEAFAARVAASLLSAIRLPELIAATPEHYEELAVTLANDPERLADIKRRLAERRLTAPLFDTQLYTRRLEAAYTAIVERYRADLPAEHVHVESGRMVGARWP